MKNNFKNFKEDLAYDFKADLEKFSKMTLLEAIAIFFFCSFLCFLFISIIYLAISHQTVTSISEMIWIKYSIAG